MKVLPVGPNVGGNCLGESQETVGRTRIASKSNLPSLGSSAGTAGEGETGVESRPLNVFVPIPCGVETVEAVGIEDQITARRGSVVSQVSVRSSMCGDMDPVSLGKFRSVIASKENEIAHSIAGTCDI